MKGCETRQDERNTVAGPQDHPRPLEGRNNRCGCVHQSHGRGRRRWFEGICQTRSLLLAFVLLVVSTNALSPSELGPAKETGVCSSLDIRNHPLAFRSLIGCRVIEGSLQILLFDNFNESAYENLSFPELREITGYLMMYRVNGLRTLADLFPNLSVIRGHKLFNNYAFILYEMMHMEEIGLHSLTDISRGSIRIEKNYMMCYVNTVDWDLIVANGKEGNYIKDNKPENECPVCPGDVSTSGGSFKVSGAAVCPLAPSHSKDTPRKEKHLCWTKDHCQKVCKADCKGSACAANGDCCDPSCLSGCSGPLLDKCSVCRDLSFGHLDNRKCIKECPPNTFKHQEWRCITESECRNISKPRELRNQENILKKPYKPINGVCMLDCPPNYSEYVKKEMAYCVKCNGTCKRECLGTNVDSIQAAEQLRGCTYIKGSLEISVRGGGSIVKELEDGLGLITDIHGSLKVARSYPLVSLNFLKSLRTIHGFDSTSDRPVENALSVTDNQNLQDLWDWEQHGPINIPRGKLFFHFNPKLCLEKIEPLRSMAKETNFTDLEVAKNSNGDKVACNVTLLNVTVVNRIQTSVLITWMGFIHDDSRSLLGYVVYFIEAPFKNVTLYEGRDACGGDGWHVDDVQPSPKDADVYHILTHLKPYTQYAVYVKTYTIATERQGAQSPIMYVQTLPGQPSAPKIKEVISRTPTSLELHWDPPDQPHGNITQYRIAVKWEKDKEDFLMQRNYCNEPLVSESNLDKKPLVEVEEGPKEKEIKDNGKCQCDSNGFRNDDEVLGQITFEDNLQNQVYLKRVEEEETRRRRDTDDRKVFPPDSGQNEPTSQQEFETVKEDGVYNTFVETVENHTSLNVSSLRHYAAHSISIWACREVDPEELMNKTIAPNNCSLKSIVRTRTLKLDGADNVIQGTVHVRVQQSNQSLGVVRVQWQEPPSPNGLIITYQIQYKRVDIENHIATTECITRLQFLKLNKSYTIKNLNAGNYSIRVMATSLAGNGNYTEYKYFFIEDTGSGSSQVLIGSVVGVLISILVLTIIAYFGYRRCMPPPPPPQTKLIASVNPEYMSAVYVPDEWEMPRDNVQLLRELGQGSFGMVYEGFAKEIPKSGLKELRCAVKTVNEHSTDRERIEFLNEASVMKAFDTAHVVRLLGVVSYGQPTLVVMELMANGDLKSYLRSHRPDAERPRNGQPPTLARFMQMAMEIADGMAYLSAKKFVHRDLAARNCMVAEDLTVKVGDFGMTRDIYETDYYRKGSKGLLPVRWMSPESLKDGVFTSSSDVWSYGVVLWEMATLASQPYQGLHNDQVLRYVIDGGVMERPENCPDKLFQLMQLTWQRQPGLRPTFLKLVALLVGDSPSPTFRHNSFFFTPQARELLHQTQPSSGAADEPGPSASPAQPEAYWKKNLASLDSDSDTRLTPDTSPARSPSDAAAALPSSATRSAYRDMFHQPFFGERGRGEPHEMEALVSGGSPAPLPPAGVKSSPPRAAQPAQQLQPTPNGFVPRSANGNPSSLAAASSRC